MLNHIVIMGRLTRDPELRYTQSNTPVAGFTVAVDRDFGGRDGGERQTDFIDCTAWRQTGEFVSKYFHKGSMIVVSGRLQSRKWEDRDGNKRTNWEINVDNVYFGESRRDSNAGDNSYSSRSTDSYSSRSADSYSGQTYAAPSRNTAPTSQPGGFEDLGEDDGELPF